MKPTLSTSPLSLLFATLAVAGTSLVGFAQQSASPLGGPRASEEPLAWGDIDGDGLADAVSVLPGGGLRLFQNTGDGALADITQAARLADIVGVRVALLADLDGDQRADLFLGGADSSRLLASLGTRFLDITEGSGLAALTDVRMARTLDYDDDGHVDLLVDCGGAGALMHGLGAGLFERVEVSLAGPGASSQAWAAPGSTVTSGSPGFEVVCALSIKDQAGGGCLEASSTPTLGMLYPLSNELFVEQGTGRVGLGTTTPGASLDVQASSGSGSFNLQGPSGTLQTLREGSQGWDIYASTTDYAIGRHNIDFPFVISYATGDAWFTNRLGVGTSSSPAVPLHVQNGSSGGPVSNGTDMLLESSGTAVLQFSSPDLAGASIIFSDETSSNLGSIDWDAGGAPDGFAFKVGGGTLAMVMRNTGFVGIGTNAPSQNLSVNGSAGKPGGGSWSVFSDARLKKNVATVEGALETLLALRGVTFEYEDPESIGELSGERIGFIAQEVEAVVPDWVDENATGYKQLTIRGFEALAVEAFRTQEQRIEALSSENREQREELASLRDRVSTLESLQSEIEALKTALAAVSDR